MWTRWAVPLVAMHAAGTPAHVLLAPSLSDSTPRPKPTQGVATHREETPKLRSGSRLISVRLFILESTEDSSPWGTESDAGWVPALWALTG